MTGPFRSCINAILPYLREQTGSAILWVGFGRLMPKASLLESDGAKATVDCTQTCHQSGPQRPSERLSAATIVLKGY